MIDSITIASPEQADLKGSATGTFEEVSKSDGKEQCGVKRSDMICERVGMFGMNRIFWEIEPKIKF